MALKFHTMHHALANEIRKTTGMEILPDEVKKHMYSFTCAYCGMIQTTIGNERGRIFRPAGTIQCQECGRNHEVHDGGPEVPS